MRWGIVLGLASLVSWLKLTFAHGRFWQFGPELRAGEVPHERASSGQRAPGVAIIVPARDEAETIGACITSLLAQDYAGAFSIFVVDDGSRDGTAAIARGLDDPDGRLHVIDGQARPSGWSGKLWALQQGVEAASRTLDEDAYILFTDADIVHDPAHLATLVGKGLRDDLDLVSEMVRLNCASAAERALVPAFVYFFALLYPFARVNDPASSEAGAAGGTILLRRRALERIGGIKTLRGALIDDCTLAAHIKRSGGRLYLGHSTLAWSRRPYEGAADIWRMIARTAYVQLGYSPLRLLGALLGLALIWFVPVGLAVFGRRLARVLGLLSWLLSVMTFLPTLRRFDLAVWRILPLPLVAGFYMAATIGAAVDHHRGRGARWKNRTYTEPVHGGMEPM